MDRCEDSFARCQRYVILAVILICAGFLRFYLLSSIPPGLFYDEAMDGNNAVEAAETNHFQVFYAEDYGREGLYVNITALIIKTFPIYEPWIIRLPAAVAGVLTVWGLYLLSSALFGEAPGLLSAFFLATSVWHIIFSRIGFRAILAPLTLIWAIWLLLKGHSIEADPERSHRAHASMIYTILAGIVYGLGFYTYIAFRITPLLLLLFIPFFWKSPGFWRRATVFIAVVGVVSAPLGWYFIQHPDEFLQRAGQISVTSAAHPVYSFAMNAARTALMLNYHGDRNWRHNISGAPELFWPVGILFILGFLLAAQTIWNRWRKRTESPLTQTFGSILILLWIVLGGLPAAASNEGVPHALRSILVLPPSMILAALGGVWLACAIRRVCGFKAFWAIAISFLFGVGAFGYYEYFDVWATNPHLLPAFYASSVDIGRRINSLSPSTPKYVVVAGTLLVRGLPVQAQPTMFVTHSFTSTDREAANIHYLLPGQENQIPIGTSSHSIFYIRPE